MQSADSSLGLSWWLLYQMPGKLQGFKNFRTTWLRLEPDCSLATAYVEFIYTPERQFAQPFAGHRILRIYFNSTTTNLAGLSLTFFNDPKKLFGAHCTPPLGALNSSASSAFEVSTRSTSETATTK